MKWQQLTKGLLGLAAVAVLATSAQAAIYSTADPGGADIEFREENPLTNRGSNSEIASRIEGGSRNSVIYLKFNVANMAAYELANDIIVQTTYRNTNLSNSRIEWTANNQSGLNTGFDYYVLDPTIAGADWDEATITPTSAFAAGLGYAFDGNFMTKATGTPLAPTAGLTYLGTKLFDSADLVSGHLPVGERFRLTAVPGSPLHDAIVAAQGTAHGTVTVAMAIAHTWDNPNGNWLNFNYLFNPKEMTDPINDPASPYDGQARGGAAFAPALVTVPEPSTIALLGTAGLGLLAWRRRR